MKYNRFEDLPVWKDAARLYVAIESLVDDQCFKYHGDLKSQLLRAALSVSNNIAEGFERGTTKELLSFLYIARGSAGEVRSMLTVMSGSARYQHLKSQISALRSKSESIGKQIRGWADSLQNSEIKGQRYLNNASRERYDRERRRERFLGKLQAVREGREAWSEDWMEEPTKPEERGGAAMRGFRP